jgi:hypothetical protein
VWREDDDDEEEDNDDYFATPKKRNKPAGKQKHKKMKTTINPDLVLGAEFGNEGGADAMIDNEEIGDALAEPKKYLMTDNKDWTMHKGGEGRRINPVPFTGEAEQFGVKLEEGDLKKMRDGHGMIRLYLVFDWLLPTFNGNGGFNEDGFYEFVAVRMPIYMMEIMRKQAFRPEHYDPFDEGYTMADHVARFFGCQLVHAIKGLPSVNDCWSTRELLNAIGMAKESMPCGAFSDMQWCMHFADDWDEEDGDVWEDNFVEAKVDSPIDVAHHRQKFSIVEDAFNLH